jgi:SagB-type dehydrogenase family enzyme
VARSRSTDIAHFRARRFRRSPHVVCYWKSGRLLFHNYATNRVVASTTLVCDVLDFFDDWRPAGDLLAALPDASPPLVQRLIRRLERASLLQPADAPIEAAERAMNSLDRWNPAAGFFHTATKDVRFISRAESRANARRQARAWRVPPAVKRYRGAPLVRLPRQTDEDALAQIALARRTWRRFSDRALPIEALGTLLGVTAGVQSWVNAPVYGRVPLKTSPSGGARHPIEVYVVVRNVSGLASGIYHYASDAHVLERLRKGVPHRAVPRYFPRSGYFARGAAIVLFTAVFERQIWRYPYARAYRAALIEAGHMAQTFCLAATSMRLAPFCLMGLADSAIERDLGIDGITESVLYAAGVGCRPRGSEWAPLPRGTLKARPNPHLTPRRG